MAQKQKPFILVKNPQYRSPTTTVPGSKKFSAQKYVGSITKETRYRSALKSAGVRRVYKVDTVKSKYKPDNGETGFIGLGTGNVTKKPVLSVGAQARLHEQNLRYRAANLRGSAGGVESQARLYEAQLRGMNR